MTAPWIALGLFVVGALAFARCLRNAPTLPDFDEHAATAAALLQPDAPLFTDAETPHADALEAWLRSVTPTIRPAFPEES